MSYRDSLGANGLALGAVGSAALLLALILAIPADAQQQQPRGASSPPAGFRKLGPGVETTIPRPLDPHDTVTYHDIVELLADGVVPDLDWTPISSAPTKTLKSMAKDRPFYRTAWYLQFTFKPLRLIEVNLPGANGRLERKAVWYMVYRVKNIGGHLKPVAKEQAADELASAPEVQSVDDPGPPGILFFPRFSLEATIEGQKQVYPDRLIPLAIDAIRRREDPNRRLLDSVSIGSRPIPLSTATDDRSVWGVATWVDVDPRIDFFSLYINGLTNAYRWTDPPGAFKAGDPPGTGRQYKQKTLQLNFWRPGDEFALSEDEILIGAPADKVAKSADPDKSGAAAAEEASPGGRNWDKIIDYRWIFR
jgi:hypothetical protein